MSDRRINPAVMNPDIKTLGEKFSELNEQINDICSEFGWRVVLLQFVGVLVQIKFQHSKAEEITFTETWNCELLTTEKLKEVLRDVVTRYANTFAEKEEKR